MFECMKKRIFTLRFLLVIGLLCVLPAAGAKGALAEETAPVAQTASITTDRAQGVCSYTVNGIDTTAVSEMTMKVTYIDTNGNTSIALEKKLPVNETNCTEGVYNDSFALTDLNSYAYEEYKVSFVIGQNEIDAGFCDFTIHKENYEVKAVGKKGSVNRTFEFNSTETGEAIVPGTDNKVKLVIYKKGANLSKGVTCGAERDLTADSRTWDVDLTTVCDKYGFYYAAVVLVNSKLNDGYKVLGTTSFQTAITYTTIGSSKSQSLEKKKAFRVYVNTLNGALGIDRVIFSIYDSEGTKILQKAGTRKTGTAKYYADIYLSKLDYKFGNYTIKVAVRDSVGNVQTLSKEGKVSVNIEKGTLAVKKSSNGTIQFTGKKIYIPGNVKKIKFNVYQIKGNKKTLFKRYTGTYVTASKQYTAEMKATAKGSYIVYEYGFTQWGKSILLNQKKFNVKKADLGKNGWTYEKYAGKLYKFYYKNNEKVTDLTSILNIKKGNNKFYIEINRAACTVTVYAYDSEKKAYIIPVKTFTVSVGRDVYTAGTAGSLTLESSFTPLGTYSVSSNGVATKYSLKTMNEPDGSVCYARWATHIVGNVYFHAVAVGSQSHYALSPYSYNKLGSPASAGCIRMTVADAKWIYDYAGVGSTVKVLKGNASKPGPFGKNATITISAGINYDPTDPAVPAATKQKDYKDGRISGYMTKNGKKVGY